MKKQLVRIMIAFFVFATANASKAAVKPVPYELQLDVISDGYDGET